MFYTLLCVSMSMCVLYLFFRTWLPASIPVERYTSVAVRLSMRLILGACELSLFSLRDSRRHEALEVIIFGMGTRMNTI